MPPKRKQKELKLDCCMHRPFCYASQVINFEGFSQNKQLVHLRIIAVSEVSAYTVKRVSSNGFGQNAFQVGQDDLGQLSVGTSLIVC